MITNKTEFNRKFKLTINGKYAGIERLRTDHNIKLFFHKLNKKLRTRERYKEKMVIKVADMTCNVYVY